MLLHERLAVCAAQHPSTTAIVFEGEEISYRSLVERAGAAQAMLDAHGVTDGDIVGWLGANQPFMIELLVACSMQGAALLPLNTRLSAAEQQTQIAHSRASLLVAEPASHDRANQIAAPDASGPIVITDGSDIAPQPSGVPRPIAAAADTPLLLVYTSGTTGAPKGAVHTQGSIAATIDNGIESQSITSGDVTLNFLPLFHVGGLNIQTLPTLVAGGTLILHRNFDPGAVLTDIERFGVTTSVFVPATMQAVMGHPQWTTADLSSVRGVSTGSSVVPVDLLTSFNDRGLRAGQVYGSTETGPTCVVLDFDHSDRVGSAGRAAPRSELRVVSGELQVRGPHLFSHYLHDPTVTDAAFDDGWYRTGDRAAIDADGFVRIDGRADELIISGGENIDPAEVENVLGDVPGVAEVVVVAKPDERWGEVPVAFVVADPGGGVAPTLVDLRDRGEDHLARYKLPTELHLVDELPKTALGKVQRFELRRRLS